MHASFVNVCKLQMQMHPKCDVCKNSRVSSISKVETTPQVFCIAEQIVYFRCQLQNRVKQKHHEIPRIEYSKLTLELLV